MWRSSCVSVGARAVTLAATLTATVLAGTQPPSYDLFLRNGRIVDGTGSPWFRSDVAIRGDVISAVAARIDAPSARVIDVAGNVIAPGFIDIHTHARRGIFEVPTAANYSRQGVTTVIEGPDGSSPVPLAPFLAKLEALQKSVNIGSFIGQGSIIILTRRRARVSQRRSCPPGRSRADAIRRWRA